jgi:hypothetical protein
VVTIVSSEANIEKNPFRKAKPPTEEDGDLIFLDSVITEPIVWRFTTSNDIRFIIHGFDAYNDSVKIIPSFKKDMLNYRRSSNGTLIGQEYIPTLFIWMNDKDVKTIYRDLPLKGLIIFRN